MLIYTIKYELPAWGSVIAGDFEKNLSMLVEFCETTFGERGHVLVDTGSKKKKLMSVFVGENLINHDWAFFENNLTKQVYFYFKHLEHVTLFKLQFPELLSSVSSKSYNSK